MPHLLWVMCLAVSSFSPFAQTNQADPQVTNPPPSAPTAVTVQGLHRPTPPPPDATAGELERRGDELRTEKAFGEAIEYYNAAVKKGDSAVLHNKLGIAYLQLVQLKYAEREFERATKLDPKYAEPVNNLGVVYYLKKKYGKAIRQYHRAMVLNDNAAPFHSNLGMAYFERKEFEKASLEFARALELDPQIFDHQGLGGVAAKMASPEDRARYAYTLARVYARRGLNDRSLEYLRKAIEEGYSKIRDVYTDEVFAGVRKDPRFAAVMAKTEPLPN